MIEDVLFPIEILQRFHINLRNFPLPIFCIEGTTANLNYKNFKKL